MNKKILKYRQGFSLIELLIGMGLVAVLIATANVFLFSSLKTARKAEAQGITKTEGSYAINAMSQLIKFSRKIENCSNSSIQVRRLNNHVVTYSFGGNKIASAGATLDGNVNVDLTSSQVVVGQCQGQAVFTCQTDLNAVDICFTVSRAQSTSVEDSAVVKFDTSVSLRNIDN